MPIKSRIRSIPDYPKKGIMFRDITTLLQDPVGYRLVIDNLTQRYITMSDKFDVIIGIEARGFILAAPLAYLLGCGFVPVRKPGKLPAECESEEYSLEYGKDKVEVHKDAINKADRVLIVDDLLATGGTINATRNLVKKLEGEIVECAFVIELPDLNGREKIKGENIFSIVKFGGE